MAFAASFDPKKTDAKMLKDVVNIVAGLTVGFGPAVGITLDGQPVLRKTVRDDHGPFVLTASGTERGDSGEQHHRMSFKSKTGIGVNVELVTWSHSPFAAISMVLENQSKHVLVWPGEQIYSVPVRASGQGLVWTLTGGPSEAAYEWPRKTIPPSALVRPGIWRGSGYEWPSKCFEVPARRQRLDPRQWRHGSFDGHLLPLVDDRKGSANVYCFLCLLRDMEDGGLAAER